MTDLPIWLNGEYHIPYSAFGKHGVIVGETGCGKSFICVIVGGQFIAAEIPFAIIDPKGDTVRDLEGLIAEHKNKISPLQRRKIVLLRDDFSIDPLHIPPNVTARSRMLSRKVDWACRSIARIDRNPDYSQMPRKYRHTTNILWFIGCGKKPLGFHRALEACQDVGAEHWKRWFRDRKDQMPQFVAKDLEWLSRCSHRDRSFYLDSTISGFRKILSAETMPLFANTSPPLDFEAVMREGLTLLCDFGPPKSREQGYALSHLVFAGLLEGAMMCRPKETYVTFVDEAQMVFGPDMEDALLRARSFNLSVMLLCNSMIFLEDKK